MGRFSVLPKVVTVRTAEQAAEVLAYLQPHRVFAVDTETTGIVRSRDHAVVISISTGTDRIVIFSEAFQYFKELLEDPTRRIIMWNANFDVWMLLRAGIDVYRNTPRCRYRVIDAMVMHAIAGDQDRPHGLKSASKEMLGIQMVDFKTVFAAQLRKKIPLREIFTSKANEQVVANYAGLDAYATFKMFLILRKELLGMYTTQGFFRTLWDYFLETEVPFTRILYEAERAGVQISVANLLRNAPALEKRAMYLHGWFARKTGNPVFNLKSNPQLADLFFGKLGYTPEALTAGGAPQLNKKWLKKLASGGCEYATNLLEYRDVAKKLETYVKGIIKLRGSDGKIHTTFNQTGARTGRLSSCIARGTLIETVRDVSKFPKGVPIEDVKVGDLAYCYDDVGRLTIARILASGKTGHRELVRVHWQGDGRKTSGYVDCTPDHLIRMVTGEYRRADSLLIGERVLSLSRGVRNGYARLWPTGQAEITREHRFIYEVVYGQSPEHVHHDDDNKLNNALTNLVGMTAEEHTSLHAGSMPLERRDAIAAAMRKLWRDDYDYRYDKCTRHGADNHTYLGLSKEWIEDQLHSFAGKPTEVCTAHGVDYATFQKYMRMHDVDFKAIAAEYTKDGELLTHDVVDRLLAETAGMPTRFVTRHVGMSFYRWAEVQRKFGHNPPNNHRIVRVERLKDSADVFDLEIAGMHNFIANEICVHNSGPNLQNQPPYIRDAYVAAERRRMLAKDYNQLEMCVLAHFTRDAALLEAISEGKDLHAWCAALMFSVPYEEIQAARAREDEVDSAKKHGHAFTALTDREVLCLYYRKAAKSIGFGLVYGMGAGKLAGDLRITNAEAKDLIARYFNTFPSVKAYFSAAIKEAARVGYCTTLFGRRRMLPGLYSALKADYAAAIRKLKNTPIQGTAAEIVKMAMISLYEDDFLHACGMIMILNVHDEIVFDVPEETEENAEFNERVSDHMSRPKLIELEVPLRTSGKYGANWAETK